MENTKIIQADKYWLDSVKNQSDTFYVKPYRNIEFVTAEYYINRKKFSVCQVMKDSSGQVRQIIAATRNIRTFTAEYFANGQLKAQIPVDSNGKYDGDATFYYANGEVRMEGKYRDGIMVGEWRNYDSGGQVLPSADTLGH